MLFAAALLLPGPGQAQSPALVDSLTRQLRRAATDSMRVKYQLLLSAQYQAHDSATTRRYLVQALRLSRKSGYGVGAAQALTNLSTYHNLLNQNGTAYRYAQLAHSCFDSLYRRRPEKRLLTGLAMVVQNEGTLLAKQGKFTAEIRAYLQAAGYATQLGDSALVGTILLNVGTRFHLLNQAGKAQHYWEQAAALLENARSSHYVDKYPYLAAVYIQLADSYIEAKRLPLAWQYLRKCRWLVQAGQADQFQADYYVSMANYYLSAKAPVRVAEMARPGLYWARQKADLNVEAQLELLQGAADVQLGRYAAARPAVVRSLRHLRQTGDVPAQVKALRVLADLEEKDQQFAAALRYVEQGHHLQDSLAATASKIEINTLENQYQARQKEQQIRTLQQGQQLQRADLRRQRTLNALYLTLVSGLLLLGVLGFLVVRQRRQRQRQFTREQEARIAALQQERQLLATEAMLRGQEEERARLARDLHDGLGGMLSTVKLYLGSARGNLVLTPESARLFSRSIEHLDSSIQEMRRVARDLMPEALLAFGLPAAVQDLCETIQHGQTLLRVQCEMFGLETRLPQRTELVVYRLVQELLNNVLKHAQARQVIVQLARHEQLVQVVVEDDGRGFDAAARPVAAGVGLRSLQARVDYLGGTLEVQSQPGQGTTVTIEFALTVPSPSPA